MRAVVQTLTGGAIAAVIPDLARLRIEVFREYPYLYEGTLDYEQDYLGDFTRNKDAIVVAARDEGHTVGCSTGSAMVSQAPGLSRPLQEHGFKISEIFYFGESVLTARYRGFGLGHAFFDHRESHARALGYRLAAFAAIIRPKAQQPANYQPLDAFWAKRGYAKAEGVIASLSWKDVGEAGETAHPMQFWMRALAV